MEERIQKLIAVSGLMSRRAAEEAIKAGRVTLNGYTAVLGEKADPEFDELLVDGKNLPVPEKKIYIMLNKPQGYVSTLSDEQGRKTVADLTSSLDVRLYPVGRLDLSSEGLLLMTNDGELANALMHPSSGVKKTYRVTVRPADSGQNTVQTQNAQYQNEQTRYTQMQSAQAQSVRAQNVQAQNIQTQNAGKQGAKTQSAQTRNVKPQDMETLLRKLTASIEIDGKMTVPGEVRIIKNDGVTAVADVTISEGRNRQVRRLCEHAGLSVMKLIRIREGPLSLGRLRSGMFRYLTEQEVKDLKKYESL